MKSLQNEKKFLFDRINKIIFLNKRKKEKAYFAGNGLMLDCSRNAVFTVEKVKAMIRILAKLGLNRLLLYTEDTYEVPELPYFGVYRGRYSREEIIWV